MLKAVKLYILMLINMTVYRALYAIVSLQGLQCRALIEDAVPVVRTAV